MTVKQRRSALDRLSAGAGRNLKLDQQIEELELENAQLKKQLAITDRFDQEGKLISLSIEQIERYEEQPRKTFTSSKLQEMVEWLRRDGQKTPIKVIFLDGRYVIYDGERRWRSAPLVPIDTLEALVVEASLEELHSEILRESLSREDLNALDRGEAILKELARKANLDLDVARKEVVYAVRLLERSGFANGLKDILHSTMEEQEAWIKKSPLEDTKAFLIQTLLDFQINPKSFATSDLRAVLLHPDLKVWIREKGLQVATAFRLNKLWTDSPISSNQDSQAQLRISLLKEIIDRDMSANAVSERVSQLCGPSKRKQKVTPRTAIATLKRLDLKSLNSKQVNTLTKELQIMLKDLESISNSQ